MSKVVADRRGIIHYVATCDVTGKQWVIFTDETPTVEDVRREVRKYVKRTGNSVTIEGGTSTTYSLK